MKKLFKVVALLLVSAIAAVALASCNPNSADESIVGYWQTESVNPYTNYVSKHGLNFKDDGSVDMYMGDETGWEYAPTGKYTFASDTLTISDAPAINSNMEGSYPCTISGNTMTMDLGDGDMTFTKTALPQGATLYTGN